MQAGTAHPKEPAMPIPAAYPLTDPRLTETQFTPTKWETAAGKAKFGNRLLTFISRDFPRTMWTQPFYRRLSSTFGHIANYDSHGFWGVFFETLVGKVEFLEQAIAWPCHGHADYTFCDVERAVIGRLRKGDTLSLYRVLKAAETERLERVLLRRLRERYEGVPPVPAAALPILGPAMRSRTRTPNAAAGQQRLL